MLGISKSGKRMKRLVRRRTRSVRRRRTWTAAQQAHYAAHKEAARALVHDRLQHFNHQYNLTYQRVSIKNTRSRWGSCSSKGNLNFNYRIIFLPTHLQDYLIIHELCHLQEMNHGPNFWALVAQQCPDYQTSMRELRQIEQSFFAVK